MITVTKEIAMYHTGIFHHKTLKNADWTPLRCRVTGQCKTWKRKPGCFRLPVKYGLKGYFYLTESNCADWEVTEAAWEQIKRAKLCDELGVRWDTPDYILHDMLEDRK